MREPIPGGTFDSPLCLLCKHNLEANEGHGWICDAFPKGIPKPILKGEFDHRKPHPEDKGIQFALEEDRPLDAWVDEYYAKYARPKADEG